jgi:hypothetical protein
MFRQGKVCRVNTLEITVIALAIGVIVTCTAPAAESPFSDGTTLVGVAKIDITPETPVRMYGYASRTTESEGIAGPLKASALVIGGDRGQGPAVMLAVDCGAVPKEIFEKLLERLESKAGIRRERFVLCHSHCHSGPDIKGMESISGEERKHLNQYVELLLNRTEDVVLNALAKRTKGRLDWVQGSVDVAANRRVLTDGKWTGFGAAPDGAVDHSLPLLRVTNTAGRLLAVVINYACHNTTLRGKCTQIHGDWAGCTQEYVEAEHPGAVCLITIGCGADSDPWPHSTVELCERHGRAIADEVGRLLEGPFKKVKPEIHARTKTIRFNMNETPPLEEIKERQGKSWLLGDAIKQIESGQDLPSSVEFRVATWCFGDDLAMVFLEDEVVVDYALRMKRDFAGDRLWINAYTNDVTTYIVSKRLIPEGGYEVLNSLSAMLSFGQPQMVEPAVEDRIVDAVREILPAQFR